MTTRATFTLDEKNLSFLQSVAGNNRSAYINHLLAQEKKRLLRDKLEQANREEATDGNYQSELANWNETLSDGLD